MPHRPEAFAPWSTGSDGGGTQLRPQTAQVDVDEIVHDQAAQPSVHGVDDDGAGSGSISASSASVSVEKSGTPGTGHSPAVLDLGQRGQRMVGDAEVAAAGIGIRHPQQSDRAPAEQGCGHSKTVPVTSPE